MKRDLHEYKQHVITQIAKINAITDLPSRVQAADSFRERHDHVVALHGWTGANCALVYAAIAEARRELRRERMRLRNG